MRIGRRRTSRVATLKDTKCQNIYKSQTSLQRIFNALNFYLLLFTSSRILCKLMCGCFGVVDFCGGRFPAHPPLSRHETLNRRLNRNFWKTNKSIPHNLYLTSGKETIMAPNRCPLCWTHATD
jgi:hypothetical protein